MGIDVFSSGLTPAQLSSTVVMGAVLPNAFAYPGTKTGLALGDNDLFSVPVPSGRKVLVRSVKVSALPCAGTVTAYSTLKHSGTYYRLGTSLAVANNQLLNTFRFGIILDAGENLGLNCSGVSGATVQFDAIEFPADCNIKSAKLFGLSTGNNTLYTTPTNTSAFAFNNISFSLTDVGQLFVSNDASGTHVFTIYSVPSGQSPGVAYQSHQANTLGASTTAPMAICASMGAGDYVVVNSSAGNAAQFAWTNQVELAT